uniref:glycosyltransferase family 2 protein n=1 Tax=Eubacterium cellulosolvens TaxID=29322 RepID=UPI000687D9E7|nr:glycosyltransferase family 2 protein [[Eubacterium] cellulosolvens]
MTRTTEPIISVIIPVYNKINYFSAAVKSVTNQMLNNENDVEIIIIDDGSTDGSSKLADDLANEDKRIRVFHQENQWIYASFNNGVKQAKGKYIYILNADDTLVDNSLQLLIDKTNEYNEPDVIWTKVLICKVDKEQNILSQSDMNYEVINEAYYNTANEIHDNWFFLQKSELIRNQANLYKRNIVLDHLFRNDFYGADTYFNLDIADSIGSMVILPNEIYRFYEYGVNEMNISMGKYYDYEHEMFNQIYQKSKKIYMNWNISETVFLDYLVEIRLRELTHEIHALNNFDCKMTMDEKLEHIMRVCADSMIRRESRLVGREREYESRVLNGIMDLSGYKGSVGGQYSFLNTLCNALPKDYRDNVDLNNLERKDICNAINNELNIDRIGAVYYSTNWDNLME